jgi:hypothetical protein
MGCPDEGGHDRLQFWSGIDHGELEKQPPRLRHSMQRYLDWGFDYLVLQTDED